MFLDKCCVSDLKVLIHCSYANFPPFPFFKQFKVQYHLAVSPYAQR